MPTPFDTPIPPDVLIDTSKEIPFIHHLGARVSRMDNGHAMLHLPLKPEFTNSWGHAHGGLVMTLLDSVMGLAVRSHLGTAARNQIVTVQMNTHFIRSATAGIGVTGRVIDHTFTMIFCEASAHDEDGRLLAYGTGTFKALSPGPRHHPS